VVMRALSKNPADRYPDVLLFAKALGDALLATPSAGDNGFMSRMKGLFRPRS
jgi:hypothetical protein